MQKYSSTGNTFAIFRNTPTLTDISDKGYWSELARREGVDGVIFLETSHRNDADFKMRYLNADGGEAAMCGNGVRALGVFIRQHSPTAPLPFRIETGGGICRIVATVPLPCLDMPGGRDLGTLDISDLFPAPLSLHLVCGVPHAVFFVTDVRDVDMAGIAPAISRHPRFSQGTNVNFVQVLGKGRIAARVYERGVEGETLSCGTGASACALACAGLLGWNGPVEVLTRGGELTVSPEGKRLRLSGRVVPLKVGTP